MQMTGPKWAALTVLVAGAAFWAWRGNQEASGGDNVVPPSVTTGESSPAGVPQPGDQGQAAAPPSASAVTPETQPAIPQPAPAAVAQNQTPAEPATSPAPAVPAAGTPPTIPVAPGSTAEIARAQQDLSHLQMMMRDFRSMLGSNPVGMNADIVKALQGANPKKLKLSLQEGQQLNGQGEVLDPWGTPYFFHQISGQQMEIRCAGPDRVLWNKDDLNVQ